MGEILSTIKPAPLNPVPDAGASITWNDKTYQSYIEKGFEDIIPHNVSAPRQRKQEI